MTASHPTQDGRYPGPFRGLRDANTLLPWGLNRGLPIRTGIRSRRPQGSAAGGCGVSYEAHPWHGTALPVHPHQTCLHLLPRPCLTSRPPPIGVMQRRLRPPSCASGGWKSVGCTCLLVAAIALGSRLQSSPTMGRFEEQPPVAHPRDGESCILYLVSFLARGARPYLWEIA